MQDNIDLQVREADLANARDAAGVVDVLNSYASDPKGGGVPLGADVRERLIPALRRHPTTLVLLAFSRDEPIGAAVCFFGLSTFRARPLLNVHDLAVVPGYRGQGVGRALLVEAEACARRAGCCKLTLEVQDDNAPARAVRELRFRGFRRGQLGRNALLEQTPGRRVVSCVHRAARPPERLVESAR